MMPLLYAIAGAFVYRASYEAFCGIVLFSIALMLAAVIRGFLVQVFAARQSANEFLECLNEAIRVEVERNQQRIDELHRRRQEEILSFKKDTP